jgi:hypothetical protein
MFATRFDANPDLDYGRTMQPAELETLTEALRFDDNVDLAVVFGEEQAGADTPALSLLVDCERNDVDTIRRLTQSLCRRLGLPLRVFRLTDARPAAILMRQVLHEGRVLKDYNGQWDRLQNEADVILGEADSHERWLDEVRGAVSEVVEADENVTLAVEFGPIGPHGEATDPADLNVLLSCSDEGDEAVLDAYARLQATGFTIRVMTMQRARQFPYAMSHIVRTARVLKDTEGEWADIQGERRQIIKAGSAQQASVRLARTLYGGGRGGRASLN